MKKIVRIIVTILAIAGGWLYLGPSAIGGPASYITVQGISMQPNLYTGDLVLLHSQSNYGVGDSVAYVSDMAGAVVIHRIIAINGDRFVLQGDNNDFVDAYQPTAGDIVGRQTLRIPSGSKVVDWSQSPAGMAILFSVAAGLFVMAMVFGKTSKHSRGKGHKSMANTSRAAHKQSGLESFRVIGSPLLWWTFTIVALVLAVVTYRMPLTTETPEPRPYTVSYDFDYTGLLPTNPVYQRDQLVYGDPVFLSVIDKVDASVDYKISNPNVRIDNGTLTLKAVLISSAGWKYVLSESGPVELNGTEARATVEVDFTKALAYAEEVNDLTGTTGSLMIALAAETSVNGELLQNGKGPGGIEERTAADIGFTMTETTAQIIQAPKDDLGRSAAEPAAGIAPGTAGASSDTGYTSSDTGYTSSDTGYTSSDTGYTSSDTGYTSSDTGYLSSDTGYLSTEPGSASTEPGSANTEPGAASTGPGSANSQNTGQSNGSGGPSRDPSVRQITQMVPTDINIPNRVSLGVVEFPVSTARVLITLILGLSLTMAILMGFIMGLARRRGPVALLAAKHGKRMVPMNTIAISSIKDAISVPNFESIRAISLETEQLIMVHRVDADTADYYVSDNGSIYHYRLEPTDEPELDDDSDTGGDED